MIKNGIRNNLFYPLMLIIFTSSRKILSLVMKNISNFDNSLILTLIMFFSEFIFGLILYLRQFKLITKKKTKIINRNRINLWTNRNNSSGQWFQNYFIDFFCNFFWFYRIYIKNILFTQKNSNIKYKYIFKFRYSS